LNGEHLSTANQWENNQLHPQVIQSPSADEEDGLEGKVESINL